MDFGGSEIRISAGFQSNRNESSEAHPARAGLFKMDRRGRSLIQQYAAAERPAVRALNEPRTIGWLALRLAQPELGRLVF